MLLSVLRREDAWVLDGDFFKLDKEVKDLFFFRRGNPITEEELMESLSRCE